MLNKAVFLDRDGVLNKLLFDGNPTNPKNFVNSWDQFQWLPGAKEGLAELVAEGYTLVVMSNQGGIGYGNVSKENIKFVFDKMQQELAGDGIPISYIFCPHIENDGCVCRKPRPGMIYKMAVQLEIDVKRSWLIGDMSTDIEAGYNALIPDSQMIILGNEQTSYPCLRAKNWDDIVDLVLMSDESKTKKNVISSPFAAGTKR